LLLKNPRTERREERETRKSCPSLSFLSFTKSQHTPLSLCPPLAVVKLVSCKLPRLTVVPVPPLLILAFLMSLSPSLFLSLLSHVPVSLVCPSLVVGRLVRSGPLFHSVSLLVSTQKRKEQFSVPWSLVPFYHPLNFLVVSLGTCCLFVVLLCCLGLCLRKQNKRQRIEHQHEKGRKEQGKGETCLCVDFASFHISFVFSPHHTNFSFVFMFSIVS